MNICSQNTFPISIQGVERMRIDASGNVGIGKTAPAYALDVSGALYSSLSGIVMGMNTASVAGIHTVVLDPMGCTPCNGSAAGVFSSVATNTIAVSSSYGEVYGSYIPSSSIYNFWRTYVNLVAGTYRFYIDYGVNTDRGIITLALDGTSVGTIDTYGAGPNAVIGSISGIVVSTTKMYRLELQMNSKNASSTGYYLVWRRGGMMRTA